MYDTMSAIGSTVKLQSYVRSVDHERRSTSETRNADVANHRMTASGATRPALLRYEDRLTGSVSESSMGAPRDE